MRRLTFSESKIFFNELDEAVKEGQTIISFASERPGKKSKLWRRLKQCKNWDQIEQEFKNIQAGNYSALKNVISPAFTAALTGFEVLLIAWIASLLAGIIFYAVYKGFKVRLKTSEGDIELELEPA